MLFAGCVFSRKSGRGAAIVRHAAIFRLKAEATGAEVIEAKATDAEATGAEATGAQATRADAAREEARIYTASARPVRPLFFSTT